MNYLLFYLGFTLFLVLLGLVMYWIFIKDSEDYFYRSLLCITGMSALVLLLIKFRSCIFVIETVGWIIIASICVIILSVVLYIWRYIFDSINDFELKLVLFLFPIAIVLYPVISLAYHDEMPFFSPIKGTGIISAIVSTTSIFLAIFTYLFFRKKEQLLKFELKNTQRYLSNEYFESVLMKNDISRSDLLKIEETITRLYLASQDETPSTYETLHILHEANITSNLLHIMMERLYSKELLKRCPIMTLVEFQQELLPELFSARRVYRSHSMDMRYYEDIIERIRYTLKNDNKTLDELNEKIDYLCQYVEKNSSANKSEIKATEMYGCQNQIRELFHALETPIATSEMAITNLVASFDTLTVTQRDKFIKIQNNIKLIKSILFAYRELTFMNVYSSENTFFSLPVIISSMKDIILSESDSVVLVQKDIPESIPPYSTNLIVVLLLPLIHNAIEASPNKKNVIVSFIQSKIGDIIQIENICKQTPSQTNLDTDGYSSKGNNHIGTGISIVRRISKSVGIDFCLKVDNNKVIAQLIFPKQ